MNVSRHVKFLCLSSKLQKKKEIGVSTKSDSNICWEPNILLCKKKKNIQIDIRKIKIVIRCRLVSVKLSFIPCVFWYINR